MNGVIGDEDLVFPPESFKRDFYPRKESGGEAQDIPFPAGDFPMNPHDRR
jgi:hypothetical protein